MDRNTQKLHDQVNQAIIRCRRVYSMWAKENQVSYNRMLVLYTIREYGICTQKQVCDSYLLPCQTVNHVITEMRKEGILEINKEKSFGKEKALVLTKTGEAYSEKLLYSLSLMEERTVKRIGEERIREMTELFMEYDRILEETLAETLGKTLEKVSEKTSEKTSDEVLDLTLEEMDHEKG